MEIKDQLKRTLHFNGTPKRIVSLVPSQTELLCDLGLKDAIVGLTKFCVHPYDIKNKIAVVGGTKQIHVEKIKALNPDIILCNKEENTKAIVESCELICPVHVSDIFTIEDSLVLMNQYGILFNKMKRACSMIEEIKSSVKDFNEFIRDRVELKVAYFIWKDPWMVAANNTFINYMLKLNRFKNIYQSSNRYPEVELNNARTLKSADIFLLSSEPFPFKEKHISLLKKHYPKTTSILVDGEMFSWYGSRLLKAFDYFKNLRLDLEKNLSY